MVARMKPTACGLLGARLRWAGRLRPKGDLEESKRKQMKAKLLSFVFMSFSESGLFKGLRMKKVNK
jgi:hypothetical protein